MRMRPDTDGDPDRDSTRVVHAAIDAGVTMVDTADMYGNEALVGRTLRGRRDEVLLCSKFGVVWGEDGDWSVRADAAYVREACDASLRRLDVETIDLYYLHHRSDDVPIEETVGAMAELVDAGKIRAVGLSNVTEEDVRRAHAVHPVAAVQEMWALSHREVEQMVPTLVELGVAVVAHSPTGHGALRDPDLPGPLRETASAHGVIAGPGGPGLGPQPRRCGGAYPSYRCRARPACGTSRTTWPPPTSFSRPRISSASNEARSRPDRQAARQAAASATSRQRGLTSHWSPTWTVGEISLPSVAARTCAAPVLVVPEPHRAERDPVEPQGGPQPDAEGTPGLVVQRQVSTWLDSIRHSETMTNIVLP